MKSFIHLSHHLVTSKKNSHGFSCSSIRTLKSLVIAEHNNISILPSTLSSITAANKIGGEVTLLIAEPASSEQAAGLCKQAQSIKGVNKVLLVTNKIATLPAEDLSKVYASITKNYTHVLAPSSNHGKNFLPRLAALADSAIITEVSQVIDPDTFKRPMYAGNAIATVKMSDAVKFLLIRNTAFDKAVMGADASATLETLSGDKLDTTSLSQILSESSSKSDRPDLATARVVVSGGRGMKSGENFSMLETLADKLGGAVGASRAAVDAGFVPNDYQVGQTGKVVAPDLYIAVGISGAIQHLTGMKDSKTIVAINKDKEAPIFQVADYGLVDDLFKVIPELSAKLSK